jgi:hypothetical protein
MSEEVPGGQNDHQCEHETRDVVLRAVEPVRMEVGYHFSMLLSSTRASEMKGQVSDTEGV